jgi:hypothetical protein
MIAYAAAVTFPHEQVQEIVGHIADRLTRPGLYRVSAEIAIGLVVIATLVLVWRLRRNTERVRIAAFWVLTMGLIWCTWRVFTSNNTELVHYPQYFPEGMALVAMTASPVESLAWITIFAGLDEAYQYWVLYPTRVTAWDFNDIYMDLLGGAAGIVFAMALLKCGRRKGAMRIWRPGVVALFGSIALGVVLWATGRMTIYESDPRPHWFGLSRLPVAPFWTVIVPSGPRVVHELLPPEGIVLIVATIAVYGLLEWRVQVYFDW